MANAFWCIVEEDRRGMPKKVMSEVIGEAARLAGGQVEAVWLTDKASDAGLKQLGEWGATRVWLLPDAASPPHPRGGGGGGRGGGRPRAGGRAASASSSRGGPRGSASGSPPTAWRSRWTATSSSRP